MNIPLERKRRAGRPKLTAKALTKQPNETQAINEIGISSCEDSETEEIAEPLAKKSRVEVIEKLPKNKRGRPAGSKNKKKIN